MSDNDNGRAQDLLAVARGALPEPEIVVRVEPLHGSCFVHLQVAGATRVHIHDGVPLQHASNMVRQAYVDLACDLRARLRGYLAAVDTNVSEL